MAEPKDNIDDLLGPVDPKVETIVRDQFNDNAEAEFRKVGEESRELAPATEPTPTNTLAMIGRAVMDPRVSVEKMVELNSLHERIMDRQNKEAFTKDFAAALAEMPHITKRGEIKNNSGNVQSRYSRWEDIDRIVRPILRAHNIVQSFRVKEVERGALAVMSVLTHVTTGHQDESGYMPLPADATGNKSATQGTGSAMSYGKRYTSIAHLNIITEGTDDDGRGGASDGELTPQQRTLIAEAEIAAGEGVAAYEAFFKARPRTEKIWLVNTGEHERIKQIAAGKEAGDGPSKPSSAPAGRVTAKVPPKFPGDE